MPDKKSVALTPQNAAPLSKPKQVAPAILKKIIPANLERLAQAASNRFPHASEKQIVDLMNVMLKWASEKFFDDWELAAVKKIEESGYTLEVLTLQINEEQIKRVKKKIK